MPIDEHCSPVGHLPVPPSTRERVTVKQLSAQHALRAPPIPWTGAKRRWLVRRGLPHFPPTLLNAHTRAPEVPFDRIQLNQRLPTA